MYFTVFLLSWKCNYTIGNKWTWLWNVILSMYMLPWVTLSLNKCCITNPSKSRPKSPNLQNFSYFFWDFMPFQGCRFTVKAEISGWNLKRAEKAGTHPICASNSSQIVTSHWSCGTTVPNISDFSTKRLNRSEARTLYLPKSSCSANVLGHTVW